MAKKTQKRTEAKKNAEALKAKKKAIRQSKFSSINTGIGGKKGKSAVPQSKKKK